MSHTVESMQDGNAAILLQGTRRLEQLGISAPMTGESLSSWSYRINLQIETPIFDHPTYVSAARGIEQSDVLDSPRIRFVDPDGVASNDWVDDCVKTLGIARQWFECQFPFFERPYVPLRYRRAFCYQCLAQSVRATGLPAWKSEWRHLAQPLCSVHAAPLLDAPVSIALAFDHPVRAFTWYWDSPGAKQHCELLCNAWPLRSAFAFDVQRRIYTLRASASDHLERAQIDGFILSLMRAVMMPCLHYTFPKIAFSGWGGPNFYPRDAFYLNFYQEIYRASSIARTSALYLCGLLLGWITEEEGSSTNAEGYFMPARAWIIWELMEEHFNLMTLLGDELRHYESRSLNISMLADIPRGWRPIA